MESNNNNNNNNNNVIDIELNLSISIANAINLDIDTNDRVLDDLKLVLSKANNDNLDLVYKILFKRLDQLWRDSQIGFKSSQQARAKGPRHADFQILARVGDLEEQQEYTRLIRVMMKDFTNAYNTEKFKRSRNNNNNNKRSKN